MPGEEKKVTTNLGRVSIVPKGVYDPEESYTRLDYVRYGDDGYLARRSGLQGVTPADGEDWMLAVGSGSAKMAQSWAVGGTGERDSEETDNAKYYAAQAESSAESAAGSVQVLESNAEAIQAIRDNLQDIQTVSGGIEAVETVSGGMAAVQAVSEGLADVRTAVERMEDIQAAPGAADRAGAADDAANLAAARAEEAADRAQSIAQGAKGYYGTSEALEAAQPDGTDGDWAIVGETDTIWIWDSDDGRWEDSGNKTDLSNYYTKVQTDAELNELQTAMAADTDKKLLEQAPAFATAEERTELTSGEKLSVLLGKISKWLTDLNEVAFSGAYNDLAGTPAALKNPAALSFTGGVAASYDGSEAQSVAIPAASSTTPLEAGTASAGKESAFARGDHVHPAQTSVTGSSGSCTGNANTATKLAAAKTINGVPFDGSENITVYDSTKLPLTGGTLTGDLTLSGDTRAIKYTSGTKTGSPITFYSSTADGAGIAIGDGGRTIIGGGESAQGLRGVLTSADNSEEMHVASDADVYIHTNCNVIANRKTFTFGKDGTLTLPSGGSFKGNLTGNVTGTAANVTGTVAVANGGTGATAAAAALNNLGGQTKHKALSLTLAAATWTGSGPYTYSGLAAAGVTASNTVIVSPAPASWTAWCEAGVRCTAQGANSLTFTAEDKPTAALTAQVVILD